MHFYSIHVIAEYNLAGSEIIFVSEQWSLPPSEKLPAPSSLFFPVADNFCSHLRSTFFDGMVMTISVGDY